MRHTSPSAGSFCWRAYDTLSSRYATPVARGPDGLCIHNLDHLRLRSSFLSTHTKEDTVKDNRNMVVVLKPSDGDEEMLLCLQLFIDGTLRSSVRCVRRKRDA